MADFDPVENKKNRVKSLLNIEQAATDMSNSGEDPAKVIDFINQGSKAVAANFPDLPQYEKAVSAVGKYKQNKAAEVPSQTLERLPY
jgi:hypothetical protein